MLNFGLHVCLTERRCEISDVTENEAYYAQLRLKRFWEKVDGKTAKE